MLKSTRPKDTKERLRQQALRLFAERGYNGVSMRDIAEAVGVRQGAIYNHFVSKQQLLVDVMLSHISEAADLLQAELEGIEGPVEQLEAMVRFHASYHMDRSENLFLFYVEIRSLEDEGFRVVRERRNWYEKRLLQILEQGRVGGQFKIADSSVHVKLVLAMLNGLTNWYRDGGRLERAAVIECHVQAAMQSVGVPYTIDMSKVFAPA